MGLTAAGPGRKYVGPTRSALFLRANFVRDLGTEKWFRGARQEAELYHERSAPAHEMGGPLLASA